jgi:hypothetical protein
MPRKTKAQRSHRDESPNHERLWQECYLYVCEASTTECDSEAELMVMVQVFDLVRFIKDSTRTPPFFHKHQFATLR